MTRRVVEVLNGTARVRVRVKPRASKSRVLAIKAGELEVAIAAPPVDGAANVELVRILAAHFDVPKSAIEIVSGQTARSKVVRLPAVAAVLQLIEE
jgi:uncharacterized protein (TIGR00251 family)